MKAIKHAIVAAALAAAVAGSAESPSPVLRIYLPRDAVVQGERIELQAIGVVRGHETAVRTAMPVAVGRFSTAGQQMVIDRETILAMLASAGIDAAQVAISGADSVTVRRDEDVIAPERFIAVAETFAREQLKDQPIESLAAITRPRPWVVPKTAGEVRLVPKTHPYSTPSRPRVWIEVVAGEDVQTAYEIAFSVAYKHSRILAAADIAEGQVIDANNVRVETLHASYPPPPETLQPYGMVARRAIPKDTVIRQAMIGPEIPPTVIKRRQVVLVKFETPLLLVSSFGEAMDDGRTGELIRVRVNSGKDAKIIVTRIQNDGTVSPAI